jgi:hypothetical protein
VWKLYTVGADEEVSLTEAQRIRLQAEYRKPNTSIYNLFIIFYRNYIIYFYFIFISVSTYQKYKCIIEIAECKLYMHVDDTKITRGTIQCLWHEEYRIQYKRDELRVNQAGNRAIIIIWIKLGDHFC